MATSFPDLQEKYFQWTKITYPSPVRPLDENTAQLMPWFQPWETPIKLCIYFWLIESLRSQKCCSKPVSVWWFIIYPELSSSRSSLAMFLLWPTYTGYLPSFFSKVPVLWAPLQVPLLWAYSSSLLKVPGISLYTPHVPAHIPFLQDASVSCTL